MVSLYPAVVVGDFGIDETSDWNFTDTSFNEAPYSVFELSTMRRFNFRSLHWQGISETPTYLYKQFTSTNIMNPYADEYHQFSWANRIGCWLHISNYPTSVEFMYDNNTAQYTPPTNITSKGDWYWGETDELSLGSIYKAGFYHDGTGTPSVYADTYVIFNKSHSSDTGTYDITDGLKLFTTRSILTTDNIHYSIEGFLHGTDLHDKVSQLRSFVTEGLVENTPLKRPLPTLHSLVEDYVKPYLLYDIRSYAIEPYPRIAQTVIIPIVISSVSVGHYSQRTHTVEVRIEGVRYGGV